MNKQKGITLIALIITIIVMLILVGVSVNIALGNGLFKSAQNAARDIETEKQKEKQISEGMANVNGQTVDIDGYVQQLKATHIKFNIDGTEYQTVEGYTWQQANDNGDLPTFTEFEGCGNEGCTYYLSGVTIYPNRRRNDSGIRRSL